MRSNTIENSNRRTALYILFLLITLGGCSSAVNTEHHGRSAAGKRNQFPMLSAGVGPIKFDVVYPVAGSKLPTFDSNFIFGSLGTGEATLTINNVAVPVARNGAYLAYLRIPTSGIYTLIARTTIAETNVEDTFRLHLTAIHAEQETRPRYLSDVEVFPKPRNATITKGSDTLATGSDAIPASAEPGGDRTWQWTLGTKLLITGKVGNEYSVELSKNLTAWIPDTSISFDSLTAVGSEGISDYTIHPDSGFVDLKMNTHFAPYSIEAGNDGIELVLYHRSPAITEGIHTTDPLIRHTRTLDSANEVHIYIRLTKPVWGYKAFYDRDGFFTLRIRRPPLLDPTEPLRGLTIMLDPGHPPGGAIGPTRLTEAEANLAIALRVREQLLARGAHVVMTRTTAKPIVSATNQSEEIWARADSAVRSNADLLISIHNNAFPEGTDPFLNNGTSTYYFYSFSSEFAEALDRRIAYVTGIENLGARKRSLAMVRPTWMPSVLTESLYMMFPEEESALRDRAFLYRLAEAHVKGIEDFLRGRVVGP